MATGDDTGRSRTTALGVMDDDGWQPQAQTSESHPSGRWPANVVLAHHPDCVGERPATFQSKRAAPLHDNGAGHRSAPPDATTVDACDCHPDCWVRALDQQSGVLKSGAFQRSAGDIVRSDWLRWVGCEANPEYLPLIQARLDRVQDVQLRLGA